MRALRTSRVLALAAGTFLGISAASATVAVNNLTPLGDLTGGAAFSAAFGVSGDASVVTGYSMSASGTEAFRWTNGGGMVGLGDLPGGSFLSQAAGISSDGNVIVGKSNSTISGINTEAFRYTGIPGSGGAMSGLGDLPGGITSSLAIAASSDGAIVVGQGTSSSGSEAFRWTTVGSIAGMGDLPLGTFRSAAHGISRDGAVIVGQGNSASGDEAFRYTGIPGSGGIMVGLGDLTGGGFNSIAYGVSDDGLTIVGQGTSANGIEAFRWTLGGGMAPLGDLAGGGFNSIAYCVSADGSVVAGQGNTAAGAETVSAVGHPQRHRDRPCRQRVDRSHPSQGHQRRWHHGRRPGHAQRQHRSLHLTHP